MDSCRWPDDQGYQPVARHRQPMSSRYPQQLDAPTVAPMALNSETQELELQLAGLDTEMDQLAQQRKFLEAHEVKQRKARLVSQLSQLRTVGHQQRDQVRQQQLEQQQRDQVWQQQLEQQQRDQVWQQQLEQQQRDQLEQDHQMALRMQQNMHQELARDERRVNAEFNNCHELPRRTHSDTTNPQHRQHPTDRAPPPPPPDADAPPAAGPSHSDTLLSRVDQCRRIAAMQDRDYERAAAARDIRLSQSARLAVMRHSVRVDKDKTADWPDRQLRPYDPPIDDFGLPEAQAHQLRDRGLHRFDVIVCSPFRRCLQTAAVVARELHVPRVWVNKQLGEKVVHIKKCQRDVWGDARRAGGEVEYLSEQEQLEILSLLSDGTVTEIERQDGWIPSSSEDHDQGAVRITEALHHLRDTCCCEDGMSVLVVAHGDTVGEAVNTFTDETCYDVKECGWVVFDFDENKQPVVRDRNLIESMVMSPMHTFEI